MLTQMNGLRGCAGLAIPANRKVPAPWCVLMIPITLAQWMIPMTSGASLFSLFSDNVNKNIKSKGCHSSAIDMVFITRRTYVSANQVSVSDPYYIPELLAYDALALIGTTTDKGKVRNRKFSELADDEKAVFIQFIKKTNPKCEILTKKEMQTFARQLLNMCFQSYQKRRFLAAVAHQTPTFLCRLFPIHEPLSVEHSISS